MSHPIMGCQHPVYNCLKLTTQWHKKTFQSSILEVRPHTNIFVKRIVVCVSRSRILIPPLIQVVLLHATFALAFPSTWFQRFHLFHWKKWQVYTWNYIPNRHKDHLIHHQIFCYKWQLLRRPCYLFSSYWLQDLVVLFLLWHIVVDGKTQIFVYIATRQPN